MLLVAKAAISGRILELPSLPRTSYTVQFFVVDRVYDYDPGVLSPIATNTIPQGLFAIAIRMSSCVPGGQVLCYMCRERGKEGWRGDYPWRDYGSVPGIEGRERERSTIMHAIKAGGMKALPWSPLI